MTDYSKTSSAVVRNYLWDQLKSYNLLNADDYIADGFDVPLIPIIPAQQVPEFNNLIGDKPYIVYDVEVNAYEPDQWWTCQENIMFSIISTDYMKIVSITNAIIDIFRRMDESAVDINNWQQHPLLFKFYNFSINFASYPAPFTEEGGRQIGQIEVVYRYSRDLSSNGRFL
jgi:hypothetical protein